MKLPAVGIVFALALLTDLIYRPLLDFGIATIDVPFLCLLWFAQTDRRSRLYLIIAALVAVRLQATVASFEETAFLLVLGVECQIMFRGAVHLRDPIRRLPVLLFTLLVCYSMRGLIASHLPWSQLPPIVLTGALVGTLSACVLFPILDAARPLVRSYRYPL